MFEVTIICFFNSLKFYSLKFRKFEDQENALMDLLILKTLA